MRENVHMSHIRFSDAEYQRLCSDAENCGLSQAAYIRHLVNGYSPKIKPTKEFYRDLHLIYESLNRLEDNNNNEEIVRKTREVIFGIEKKYLLPQ